MMPASDSRITKDHLARVAIVYIRQSSPDQVRSHTESTRNQRGLQEKAVAMGWPDPIIIDDDLGISAGGFSKRPGFQEMLARVAMRKTGIILCSDASRLSRNSRDWAHLFELCSYFDTLIADADQVYDLSQPNDRLVLGIKGTMSEMEMGILKARLRSAIETKAKRGELRINLPAGYVYDSEGLIAFDPDRSVQHAISLMFDQLDRSTSVRQLAMWYQDTKTLFPVKKIRKEVRTTWAVPVSRMLYQLLAHPIYTGAYVWGRRTVRVEYRAGILVKRSSGALPPEQCKVFIPEHHPAYISPPVSG